MKNIKKTKIVATIGPATKTVDNLVKLSKAGMNIARINFSHGTKEQLIEIAENVKEAEKKSGRTIGLLQDLQGPKIRTGDFKGGEVVLKNNSIVEITSKSILGTAEKFSINVRTLFQDTKLGDRIILNDGYQELKIVKKNSKTKTIFAKVVSGGKIKDRRGASFPDSNLSLSSLTKKDKEDIDWFAKRYQPDFIAFSFVKTANDVKELRSILKRKKIDSMIIAKMETAEGVRNFDEILELVDGIMVARGDLGVEFPAEELPFLQKMMIRKANNAGKPVITATQMLESMIQNPVPTRAEVTDIANAILDGTDAVMLSAETSVGKYPFKAVETMSKVAIETENDIKKDLEKIHLSAGLPHENTKISKIITKNAVRTAEAIGANNMAVFTETGFTALNVSKFRPNQNVFVFSPNERVLRKTTISYGLFPADDEIVVTIIEAEKLARDFMLKRKKIKKNENFVIVAGLPFRNSGSTNIIYVSEK